MGGAGGTKGKKRNDVIISYSQKIEKYIVIF